MVTKLIARLCRIKRYLEPDRRKHLTANEGLDASSLSLSRKSPIVAVPPMIHRGTLFVCATIPCVPSRLVIKLRT